MVLLKRFLRERKLVFRSSLNKEMGAKEVMDLSMRRSCRFYRDTGRPNFGNGIGCCDLGVFWSICEGDVKFCEDPNAMIRVLFNEWKVETGRPVVHSVP